MRSLHLPTSRGLRSAVLAVAVSLVAAGAARAATPRPASIRVDNEWRLAGAGVSQPAGIAYTPNRGVFFVLGARPDGGGAPGTIAMLSSMIEPTGAVSVDVGLLNPINVAFDASHDRLLLFDDTVNQLLSIPASPDGGLDAAAMTRLATPRLGPIRAAGMAVDPATGTVYLLDRLTRRIARFTPDSLGTDTLSADRRGEASWIALRDIASANLRGLAFDPAERHFLVLDPEEPLIYEIDLRGDLVDAYDVEGAGFLDPQAMVLAPSADATDDHSIQSLYLADTGGSGPSRGRVLELSLSQQEQVSVATAAIAATLVRTIDTSIWTSPSPDPSGIAYDRTTGRLFIVDGEVEEVDLWENVNFYEMTLTGTFVRGSNLTGFSIEPVGIAVNSRNRHVFVSDDDQRRVFDITPGPDGRVGTSDDTRISFSTSSIGSGDPEGLAYDSLGNRLFIADGVNAEIYEVSPGPDGLFNGVGDVVRHFDTARHGASDPEAVEFNPDKGTLYVMGSGEEVLLELTTTGELVGEIDLSGFNLDLDHAAGLAYAPSSNNANARSIYISDRGVDNDSDSDENDGRVFEIGLGAVTPPVPPPGGGGTGNVLEYRVAVGSDDAEESAGGSVSLSSSDLELVEDGNAQRVGLRFTSVMIPRGTSIAHAWIQFKVDEATSTAASLLIQGQAADNAATFTSAANNVSSRPRTAASATWVPAAWSGSGTAGPAQQTPDLRTIVQEIVNRPGWVSGNALALILTGSGKRVAEAYEGDRTGAPLLHIELGTVPPTVPTNLAPTVDAGPNQSITFPAEAVLDATVLDDGLPAPPALTYLWERGSGPGVVTFVNRNAVDTRASFDAPGNYVLRLTASDGVLSARDSLQIEVRDSSAVVTFEKRVATGNDDAEEKASGSMSLDSSDLELVDDGGIQRVGMRWTGVTIPRGATIVRAWIQFKVDEVGSAATSLTLRAHAVDNAAAFASTARNLSLRPLTTASVAWAPPAWPTTGQAGTAQRTTDLTAIVQEVVNRTGWNSGNALAVIVTGTGKRTARAFEGEAAAAAQLHIEYR